MAQRNPAALFQSDGPVIRTIHAISTICGVAASAMIFAAVLITCQLIWVRFVLNLSTIWQTEAVIYLMIAATMIGLPYVQKMRGHVNVDLIPMLLPKGLRKALAIFTLGLTIAIIAIMAFYGFEFWLLAFERNWKSDTVWAVPLWIPYLALPVGFGVFLLQLIADLVGVATEDRDYSGHGDFEEDY
jgi:TRAP-type C4-dicarboxylate transport system permease small subunit